MPALGAVVDKCGGLPSLLCQAAPGLPTDSPSIRPGAFFLCAPASRPHPVSGRSLTLSKSQIDPERTKQSSIRMSKNLGCRLEGDSTKLWAWDPRL